MALKFPKLNGYLGNGQVKASAEIFTSFTLWHYLLHQQLILAVNTINNAKGYENT